ncbi:T9SS type A sorting domain-containing protein [Aureispira anguillae]|uniref:T9SS type A sorting domain-containing protein n=1 Tax=Aureispira anguillae TaxID=2864201 RepID=A0A916DPQ7_9BACT|nr:T9SS type A sorting domain-containing protein [Aureispira anguillae]BDS10281.1 T9SS type A sorting domain-containing protein [Aureispira anguillae]
MKNKLCFFRSPVLLQQSIFLCFLLWSSTAYSQCTNPDVLLSEDFESNPVAGANTGVIYGGGSSNHNSAYILSGTRFGWFNVVNGIGNVDVYDRAVSGLCVDSMVQVSFWSRQSFGTTNVTFNMIDDAGNILATSTVSLTSFYQQYTFNFVATTPGMRFVIHCNSTGGNGVDIVMEDLLITHCCTYLLPIQVRQFNAACLKSKVELTWEIEQRDGNNDVRIERSKDGFSFEEVGRAEPREVQNNIATYRWVDDSPLPAMAYYRLVMTNLDGSLSYSSIIATYCESVDVVTISPNPFKDIFTIQFPFEASYPSNIEVLDYTGRKVYEVIIKDKTQFVEILLGNQYPAGTYFVKVSNASASSTHRIVKAK